MKFPASDKEKELVHLSCCRVHKSLSEAADSMNALENLLKENHIAMSEEYRKIVFEKIREISSSSWRIKVQAFNMNKFEERIIEPP